MFSCMGELMDDGRVLGGIISGGRDLGGIMGGGRGLGGIMVENGPWKGENIVQTKVIT